MKWETKLYQSNTDVKNKLDSGYKFIDEEGITDNDFTNEVIYYLETLLSLKSFYHVGCGMGDLLININLVYPELALGGCDLYDLYISYGHNYFKVKDYNFDLKIKEYPYFDIKGYDLIYLGKLLDRSKLSREILAKAVNDSDKVLLWTQDLSKLNEYMFEELTKVEDWNLVSVSSYDKVSYPTYPSTSFINTELETVVEWDGFSNG